MKHTNNSDLSLLRGLEANSWKPEVSRIPSLKIIVVYKTVGITHKAAT